MSRLSRLLNVWRGSSLDKEFDEELRFHLEMREKANVRAGMSPDEAGAEARRYLGSRLRAREGMRDARVASWIDAFVRDLRHGARMFCRRPGLAALAVLTLSLGIGANAAIFSLIKAILLKPLPFADPDRLVAVSDNFRTTGTFGVNLTVAEALDVREWSRDLDGMSFFDTRDFQLTGGDEPVRVFAARVEASLLTVLGVQPAYGRVFVEGEDRPGRDRVIVMSDGLWRRSFGADPAIVGRQLMVNGAAHTVLGVLPPEFSLDYWSAEPIEMFVPYPMNPIYTSRSGEFASVRRVTVVARLRARLSVQDASAELGANSKVLAREYPALYRRGSDGQELGFFMDVRPLKDAVSAQSRPVLMFLLGGVGLVLLIACVNTVQFLLARSIERESEIAVRMALGAGRARLIQQLLAEALVLAAAAAVVGLAQAAWLVKGLGAIVPGGPRVDGSLTVDLPVLMFTASTALVTTLACGMVPALRLSLSSMVLQRDGLGISPGRSRSRQFLIAVEVAVSTVLLAGASVLVHSLRDLYNAPAGYSAEDVTVMRMRMPPPSGNATPVGSVLYQRYLERIVAIRGVDFAAVAAAPLPFFPSTDFAVEGRSDEAAALSRQQASYLIVSPGYFSVLRIPLRQGRVFAEDDIVGRPPVAIVNEEMATRFWPGRSPIGQRIRAGQGPRVANLTVVGVVGNVRPVLQRGAVPQIYVSYLQQNEPSISLLVRTTSGATVSADAIKKAVWSVADNQPVFDIRPMTAVVLQLAATPRTVAWLLASFAVLALIMSATGVYTLVAYVTSQRIREVALRRAIGARARDVLSLLAGQTLRWTCIGLLAGVAFAFAGSGLLRGAVPGVTRVEPVAVMFVGAAYLAVVAIAMCIPAFKALRVDPSSVLRTE